MKKLFVVLFSMFLSVPAFALCVNLDRDNCVDVVMPDIMKYTNELKANSVFMRDSAAVSAWNSRADQFKQRADMCTGMRCTNLAFIGYHN